MNRIIFLCSFIAMSIAQFLYLYELYLIPTLIRAVKRKNIKKINYLLSNKKVDIYEKDKNGMTALHHALRQGNIAIADLLITYHARANDDLAAAEDIENHLLFIAPQNKEVIKHLLDQVTNSNQSDTKGQTLLMEACGIAGSELLVKALLERGADVHCKDIKNYTALKVTAFEGSPKIAQLLLDNGATLEEDFSCPIAKQDPEDATYITPLFIAAYSGNVPMIDFLISKGAHVNKQNTDQLFTALHGAAGLGQFKAAECLIKHGADINAKDKEGLTPLDLAIKNVDTKMMELLVDSGGR